MSKWCILTKDGYQEISNPPYHDHWDYDYNTDTYYEQKAYEPKKGDTNDLRNRSKLNCD